MALTYFKEHKKLYSLRFLKKTMLDHMSSISYLVPK